MSPRCLGLALHHSGLPIDRRFIWGSAIILGFEIALVSFPTPHLVCTSAHARARAYVHVQRQRLSVGEGCFVLWMVGVAQPYLYFFYLFIFWMHASRFAPNRFFKASVPNY